MGLKSDGLFTNVNIAKGVMTRKHLERMLQPTHFQTQLSLQI